jgi:hypothetical protein
MTTILNASTSAGLIITPDTSGNIQLQYNGQAAPAFFVYCSAVNQTFSSNTWTKVNLDTEVFDTNNNFASYRFTPTVAGYYQINGCVHLSNTTNYATQMQCGIYKNGVLYLMQGFNFSSGGSQMNDARCVASGVLYLNGSTDYVELYAYETAGGTPAIVGADTYKTSMSGCLLRGA